MAQKYDYSNVQHDELVKIIKGVLSGVNQQIQEATKYLKGYTKVKESIRLLTFILVNNADVGVRQLVTVLLKRNLINLYGALSEVQQQEFRTVLLTQFNSEKFFPVQKGIAHLIGLLLPCVELKNWPELQKLFEQALATTPNNVATLVLLNSLLAHFNPPAEIKQYLIKCLENENLLDYALKCLYTIVDTQDDFDVQLASQIVAAWQQKKWSEETNFSLMEILSAMAEKRGKISPDLVLWVCDHIIANTKLSDKLRNCGLDFIFTVSDFQGKLIANNEPLLRRIVEVVCLVCSEPPHEHHQPEEELLQDVALWLIETFALSIKQRKVYPVLFEAANALINSNEVYKMNTGFLVLAGMTEGCTERVRKNLQNPIMNVMIPKGLAHQAPEVRGAAINALCYFSEFLLPDIVSFHETIITSLMKYIGDVSTKVAEKSLMALDIFFENMEEDEVTKYLGVVVPRLIAILHSDKSSYLMKRGALSGIGSLISAAQNNFQPYVEGVFHLCVEILKLPASPEMNGIRAENISVLGKLAGQFCQESSSIKKQFFQTCVFPYLEPLYATLLHEQDPEVREACFCFFYLLASAIGNEFEHIFDKTVELVIKACNQVPTDVNAKGKASEFSLDSDSEDEEEGGRVKEMHVKTTELAEKAAAIHALGEFAKACPAKFVPYFQEAYQILEFHHQYHDENVRIQVVNCYENMTLALIKSKYDNKIPAYKKGIPCVNRLDENLLKHLHEELLPRLMFMITEEDSSQVAACAIEALDNLTKQIGPCLIDTRLEELTLMIINLLEGKDNYIDSEEEQEEEEEPDETNVYIFEPLCDFIPRICKTIKEGFEPCFKQIFPSMMKYAQEREDINDNIQIMGSFSQIFKHLPGVIPYVQEQVLPRIVEMLKLGDEDLNRNLVYCIGVMMENSKATMEKHLPHALTILKDIYETSISPPTKENAVSSICRLIYTYNPPLPLQLFVDNIIKLMPFKGDETEERTVLKTFVYIAETNGEILKPHIQTIIKLLEHDLNEAKKYKIKEPLLSTLKAFYEKLKTL